MHDDRLCGMRSAPNESRERYGMPPTSQPHINPFSRHDDPVHELHQQLSATHLHADTPAHTQTTCHTAPPESSSAQGARFPPGLFARLRAVKPETAAAFRALRDAWECANDKDAILQQARECVPILMTWGDLNLSFSNRQSLLPRCETLIEAINHVIRPVAGDVIADRGIQVVKAAVQDEAVVDTFLRILSTCSLDGHSGGGREHAWSDRGNVHMHVSCDRCGVCPITGSRFKALNHVNYDLCSQCHGNPHVNVGGYSFVQLKTRFEIHCNIGCDGCAQMPILGPRYKATDAPSYDLCGTCYRNPERRGEHGFVELRYEVSDMLRPLQSTRPGDVTPRFEVPVTPIVAYNEHAGFMTGMRFPVLVCDGCQEQLFMGRRYTATNYPNYDLCVACYNDSSVNMYGMKFIEINRPAAGILGSDNLNMVNVRFGASNARLYTD